MDTRSVLEYDAMQRRHEPLSYFHLVVVVALVVSAIGAGLMFLAGAVIAESDYFEPTSDDLELLMFGAAAGFIGACTATYGILARSAGHARVGAIGQALAALLVMWLFVAAPTTRSSMGS